MKSKYWKILLVILAFAGITTAAFWAAASLEQNTVWQEYIGSFGIFGATLIGIVCGLNAFVPIPPATFAPLFLESGLSIYWVITGFVVGTTMADSIGYLIGSFGRNYVNDKHPKITKFLQDRFEKNEKFIPFIVFTYFALAPLPNEIILIPLALIGYQYRKLLLPLIFGNIIHHSLMVLGYSQLFSWLF